MTHIRIELTREGHKTTTRQYREWADAMEAWDQSIELALGGERWRMINLETGSIMSEYTPVQRDTEEGV